MKRLCLVLILCAVLPSAALAKDYKSMPAADVGGRWVFGFQNGAKAIDISPGFAYGGTFTQIIDFNWARNMAFEVNFLHSVSHGEESSETTDDVAIFDLTMDTGAVNVAYFFSGRKLLPYISAGFGVVALKYIPQEAAEKMWEQDLYMNMGGGSDWTIWENKGSGALDRILLGARVRYEYVQVQEIFDVALNAVTITGRFELRF